jgi:diguanylate cyclase (GGDEF)-like protein/PAS domain S-box-containing protein
MDSEDQFEERLGTSWIRIRESLKRTMQSSGASTFSVLFTTTTAIVSISSVALIGWGTHALLLASWLTYAVPIAPLAALLLIAFAILLLADGFWPNRVYLRIAMALTALFAIFEGAHVLLLSVTADKVAELFFFQHMRVYPALLIGKISPHTGLSFVLAGLFLLLCALRRWNRPARVAADILAVAIFCAGAFPLIGYLHGTPLLYGGEVVPIALPTAVLFVLLSVALMAHAPARSRVLHLFLGSSTQARLIRAFLPSLALLMLVVSLSDAELVPWLARANPAIVDSLSTMLVLSATTLLIFFVAPRVGRDLDAAHKALTESQGIAAAAFESSDGIVISDAKCVILRVNRAFSQITGYSAEEAVGHKTNLLKSGHHEAAFYAAMWESILARGAWSGEIWNRSKDGEIYPHWLNITAVKGVAGEVTHYVATLTDITLRKEAEEEIRSLAFYDSLTHLPNRRLLLDRLQHALAASARSRQRGALLFIDLDDFKTLNDTLGHNIGDQLLIQVAERLKAQVRETDTVSRLGGDEFVILLESLSEDAETAAAEIQRVGEGILSRLELPYALSGHEHRSTVSIGAAIFGENRESIDELMKRADIAMYKAKAEGRNTMRFFDQHLEAAVIARVSLEKDLRHGIANGELLLHFQPQVDSEGSITGAEALVRWEHPRLGLVSPGDFIPLAEETGLILPLGCWVMEKACAQIAAWAEHEQTAHLTLAVNVSARQFQQPEFVGEVLSLLARTNANPRKLKLELTETVLLSHVEFISAKMAALNEQGLTFSLDDFGTGYSSLSYLRRLPLSQLKIDQSFVHDLLTDTNDAAVASTIIALAHSLGLAVIAEGVETWEQLEQLKRYGCGAFQGYLFGRPVPIEEFGQICLGRLL